MGEKLEIMHTPREASAALDVAATVGLILETLVVTLIGVGYVVYALFGGVSSGLAWSLAGIAILMGSALAALTWGWVRRKRFALGGALTWQLMQGCVAVWLMGTQPWWALVLLVVALVTGAAVLRRHAALAKQEP